MRVIFLSERECILSVNGVHFGLVDGFERTAELSPDSGVICELAPLSDFLPVRFRFDSGFLFSPPPQVQLYFSESSVAIYVCDFLRADQSKKPLWEEFIDGTRLTLIQQGKLRVTLENETGLHETELPDALEGCTVRSAAGGILLESNTAFVLLGRDGTVRVRSEGRVTDISPLTAEIPFHDALGHTAICSWENDRISACTLRAAREPTASTFALALFESALIGADTSPYLHEKLLDKADALREFLGDFRSVVLTGDQSRIGLTYERRERVFEVRYFRVEIEDGKVSNIIPLQ